MSVTTASGGGGDDEAGGGGGDGVRDGGGAGGGGASGPANARLASCCISGVAVRGDEPERDVESRRVARVAAEGAERTPNPAGTCNHSPVH